MKYAAQTCGTTFIRPNRIECAMREHILPTLIIVIIVLIAYMFQASSFTPVRSSTPTPTNTPAESVSALDNGFSI